MTESDIRISRPDASTAVVALIGDHDVTVVELFRAVTERALADTSHLILDVSETTFIDTLMLNAVVRLARRCRNDRVKFQVAVGDTSNTWRVLEITGLTGLFDCVPSVAQALASRSSAPTAETASS